MNPRILQYLQNALLTAVTVVLALVVLSAFLRIIRPPDNVAAPTGFGADATATTPVAAGNESPVTTTTRIGDTAPTTISPQFGDGGVCSEPVPPPGSGTVLRIYYPCGSSTTPNPDTFVYREVPETDLVLTKTLEEMVLGPDAAEAELGFTSFFSEQTTRSFASVRIANGRAIVDFTDLGVIENLAEPPGPDFFLATVGANVFQFDTISAAEYRLGGSCDAFYALLQQECTVVTRQSWNEQVAGWRGSA